MTATAGSERADSRDSERAEIVPLVIEFVDVLCQPRQRDSGCRLAVERVALGPAGGPLGDGGAGHPLGGGCVGPGARRGGDSDSGMAMQRAVAGRVIRDAVLPTAPHDSAPATAEGADRAGGRARGRLAAAYRSCAHGLWWRLVSASVTNAWRRRLLQAQRKRLPCVCRTRPRRRPGRRRRRGCRGWGSARGAPNVDDFSRPAPRPVCCPEPTRLLLFSRRLRARRSQWRPNAARRGASACSLSAGVPRVGGGLCEIADPT